MAVSAAQQAGQFMLFETGPGRDVPRSSGAAGSHGRPVRGVPDARGPVRLSHGVAGRAPDHPVLPVLPVGAGPPAGRAGTTSGADGPGLDATQARLPLAGTLETLRARRRHAQIAARHALDGDAPV